MSKPVDLNRLMMAVARRDAQAVAGALGRVRLVSDTVTSVQLLRTLSVTDLNDMLNWSDQWLETTGVQMTGCHPHSEAMRRLRAWVRAALAAHPRAREHSLGR